MYLVGIFKHSSSVRPHYTKVLSVFITLISLCFVQRTTSQSTASKQVSTFTIEAPELNGSKKIWIYLPKSYSSSKKSYPVIYMHDGQNLFDKATSYVGEWKIDEFLDSQTNNESIIVGIAHGNEKRIDELTPFSHPKYGGGLGNEYLSFVVNTLKPYIDYNYRTKSGVQYTGIWGSSLGGLISFYSVLKYPNIFGWAGVFSPAFWINPEISETLKTSEIGAATKFYFLAGTEESETMVSEMSSIITLLKNRGVKEKQLQSKIVEGGKHNEQFWAAYFGEAYNWTYPKK